MSFIARRIPRNDRDPIKCGVVVLIRIVYHYHSSEIAGSELQSTRLPPVEGFRGKKLLTLDLLCACDLGHWHQPFHLS